MQRQTLLRPAPQGMGPHVSLLWVSVAALWGFFVCLSSIITGRKLLAEILSWGSWDGAVK